MEQPKAPLEPHEIEKLLNDLTRGYVEGILYYTAAMGQSEVNFIKKTMETPDGGLYLFQFQHVSGPKIDLKDIRWGTSLKKPEAEVPG